MNALCEVWFKNSKQPSPADHKNLNAILDQAVERYKELTDEEQETFKGQLVSFRSLYAFLSQVIPYQDSDLEKLYTYLRFLLSKLPRRADGPGYQLEDQVSLQYYRLQKISEGAISLKAGEPEPLYGPTEVGTGLSREEKVQLSLLIYRLNERFGTEFTQADEWFFDQVAETAMSNGKLQEAAKVNSLENFTYVFEKMLTRLFIERMEGNDEIFSKLMNDPDFRKVASQYLVKEVYTPINKEDNKL